MSISSSAMERTAKAYVAQQAMAARLQAIDELVALGRKMPENAAQEKISLVQTKWQLNLWLLMAILLVVAVVVMIVRALPEAAGLLWLFAVPPLPSTVGDISIVLGPLVAISLAIERLLESGFDWYEQSTRAVANVLETPKQVLDWIGREYQEAYEAAKKAAETLQIQTTPDALNGLAIAEERLARAEERLRGWIISPEYKAWKRALTIWVGLIVGLVSAVLGDLGMLHLIGFSAPRLLDMLVTGLVIGAGPGPMHSLIGILQSGKDALNNLADLSKTKALREVAALQK